MVAVELEEAPAPAPVKRRGRPKGSKNKSVVRRAYTRRKPLSEGAPRAYNRKPLSEGQVILNQINELKAENVRLLQRNAELELGFNKIEAALSGREIPSAPKRRGRPPRAFAVVQTEE